MKIYIPQLSPELFKIKLKIEKELSSGNKTNEDLYLLIQKSINFLSANRKGESISKKLPIFKYFQKKFGITNLYLIKLNSEARALYTHASTGSFKILQIILEIHKTHKEYEKRGAYNKH